MGNNPQGIMNIYEIIRRRHQGRSISGIANTLNLDRKTVRHYVHRAQQVAIRMEEPQQEEAKVLLALKTIIEGCSLTGMTYMKYAMPNGGGSISPEYRARCTHSAIIRQLN
jgi:orotate phosphoribosyltransferase-like protein